MHDITEGGFYGALWEVLSASSCGCEIQIADVPVLPETRVICDVLQLDPLGLISSGSLLIAAPPHVPLQEAVGRVGVKAYPVGRVTTGNRELVFPDGHRRPLPEPMEDELWRFLSQKTK